MDTHQRSLQMFLRFFTGVLVVAILWWAREVLVPLALSAVLAFLLNPLVKMLGRCRLPRAASVVIVTLLVFSFLGLVFGLVGKELHHLASELPNYRSNIRERVEMVRQAGEGSPLNRLRAMVAELTPDHPRAAAPAGAEAPPPDKDGGLASRALNASLSVLANALGVAAIVVVFVIFMLLRQEDISRRVVALVGFSRLTTTTRAMDEIGNRISRYLLMLATVNTLYGVLLATGLYFIGLPYVLLWGLLAALFRFIPYVGPWIVAILPVSLSLAVFDGWAQPLMVVGLILALELVTNMVLEPLLYGHSVGVSDFALLVAITFWTWLWGGLGLVLATPLTVCLVVICKYIPHLAWVDILMAECQSPQVHLMAYQRLIAHDEEAFHGIVQESVQDHGIKETLDRVALPALVLARREFVLGKLDHAELADVLNRMEATLQHLADAPPEEPVPGATTPTPADADDTAPRQRLFARPLNGSMDTAALQMLQTLLPPHVSMHLSQGQKLTGEVVEQIKEQKPALVVIGAMRPNSLLAAETLCRRIRHHLPGQRILVCRWGLPGQASTSRSLQDAGATWVAATLADAVNLIEEATVHPH